MNFSDQSAGIPPSPEEFDALDLGPKYTLLASVTKKILEEKDISKVLQIVCEEACHLLNAERSMIVRVRAEEFPRREILHSYKIPPEYIEGLLASRSEPVLADVFRAREPEVIFDLSTDPRAFDPEFVVRVGHRTACAIPLIVNEEPFGTLNLYHLTQREYSSQDLQLAKAFGALASAAIEKNQLVDSLEGHIDEQKSLQRALQQITSGKGAGEIIQNVLAESEHVMGTGRCTIMLQDERTGELRLFASQGISSKFGERLGSLPEPFPIGQAYISDPTKKEPVVIPDVTLDPEFGPVQRAEGHRTMAVFPLRMAKGNIGTLFYYWTSPTEIDDHLLLLGQAFADHVAIVLDKARITHNSEQRAARLEIVDQIARAVNSTLDPDDLFRTIVHEIRTIVPFKRCTISSVPGWVTFFDSYSYDEQGKKLSTLKGVKEFSEWLDREVYKPKRVRNIRDVRKIDAKWASIQAKEGFRSMLFIPILQEDRCIAHIGFSSDQVNSYKLEHEELLTSIAGHLGAAIRNASLFKSSEERLVRFSVLNDLNQKITENLDLEDVLARIAESTVALIGADHVQIFMVDEDSSQLKLRASAGGIPWPELAQDSFSPGEGFSGTVFQNKQPIIVPDIQDDSRFINAKWAKKEGLHAFISLPILKGQEALGVISCLSRSADIFGEETLDLLGGLASQAAVALNKGRLFEKLHEHVKRQEITATIGKAVGSTLEPASLFKTIISEIRQVVPCDRCSIVSLSVANFSYRVWHFESDIDSVPTPLGENAAYVQWAAREIYGSKRLANVQLGKSNLEWAARPLENGVQSIVLVPILQANRCIAHLSLSDRRANAFTKDDEELLALVAGHLGSAIRNASLYQEAEDRAERLEIVARISKAVGSELKPEELFNIIVKQIHKYVPCERVGISRVDRKTRKLSVVHYKSNMNVERHIQDHPVSDEFFQTVYKEKRIRKVPDIRELSAESYRNHAEAGLCTHLVIPILNEDECIAHISLFSADVGAFSKENEELLTAIAAHLGPALQNARLYEESEKKGKRLSALVGATKQLTQGMDLDMVLNAIVEAAGALFDGEARLRLLEGQELVIVASTPGAHIGKGNERLPIEGTFAGKVFSGGVPLIATDLNSDPRATTYLRQKNIAAGLGLPIQREGQTIGTLHILREKGYQFDEDAIDIASSFADQAAIAIENARLHEEASKSLEFFRSVVGDNADAIMVTNLERKILHWNAGAEKLYGYTEEEALRMFVTKIIPEGDQLVNREKLVYETGESLHFEAERLRKNGSLVPVSITISPVKNDGGEVIAASIIHKDLTENRRAEETLMLALDEAKAASQAKSEFLSMMSHELRSPLGAVIGFSDLLLRDTKDEMVQQLAPKIRDSGKFLLAMIEEMLDLDRIEAGKVSLKLEPASINDLVSGVVNSWHSRLPEEFSLSIEVDPVCGVIDCDPTRVFQILNNLIDNAVKYSPDGGAIAVRTRATSDEVFVSVSDEGMGIGPGAKEVIFDRFQQLESGYKRRAGGLGIGLALARELMELHGGRIWVDSEEGEGSAFSIALPRNQAIRSDTLSHEDGEEGRAEIREPWAGRTILIVDDEDHYHEYMKLLMRSAARLIFASNGLEAIEAARRDNPDLILMDLRMPVLDGFEAIERLKFDSATQDIPIIAVTAQAMKEDRIRSARVGANGFVTKPVDIAAFRGELEQVLDMDGKFPTGTGSRESKAR